MSPEVLRKSPSGFTLLEVMVAMAVLGVALLALLTLHHQSLQSVIHSRDIARAAMLSEAIMSDAELQQFPQVGVTRGNFQKIFPGQYKNFKWERDVEPSGIFPDVCKVRVLVFYGANFSRTFSITEYLHNPLPPPVTQ